MTFRSDPAALGDSVYGDLPSPQVRSGNLRSWPSQPSLA